MSWRKGYEPVRRYERANCADPQCGHTLSQHGPMGDGCTVDGCRCVAYAVPVPAAERKRANRRRPIR